MAQQQGAYGAYGAYGANSGMGVQASPMPSPGRYMFYMHYTCAHTFTHVTSHELHVRVYIETKRQTNKTYTKEQGVDQSPHILVILPCAYTFRLSGRKKRPTPTSLIFEDTYELLSRTLSLHLYHTQHGRHVTGSRPGHPGYQPVLDKSRHQLLRRSHMQLDTCGTASLTSEA